MNKYKLKDSLGFRMKTYYEEASRTKLVRRMPVIIRLDGCHFHTVTKGLIKPFDIDLTDIMQKTMLKLCENIQGCVLGYTQSDEITLVLVDYDKLETDAWYSYEIQKITSVSAALATLFFKEALLERIDSFKKINLDSISDAIKRLENVSKRITVFDSRAFNIPKEEVANCLLWRQKDAYRNAISSTAQAHFSQKQLNGLNKNQLIEKLKNEAGIDFNTIEDKYKYGSCAKKSIGDSKTPSKWYIDDHIPEFIGKGRAYIETLTDIE